MNQLVHKTNEVDNRETSNVTELIDAIKSLTLVDSDSVQVQNIAGYPVRLYLMEETLSDGSTAYTIVFK